MALATGTYGTVADVQRRVRDLVPGGEFGDDTTVTREDIEAYMNDVADMLNDALRSEGYAVPVAATGNDIQANGRLAMVNVYGAASMALGHWPTEAFNPENPDMKNRMDFFWSFVTRALEDIREHRLSATRETGVIANVFGGSQEDDDGNTKLPVFTREITDYPGSRSLTKPS